MKRTSFFAILFLITLLSTPQAEAHVGNDCLAADYADENHTCYITEEETLDGVTEKLKPARDHVDSTRFYDLETDELHRHKPLGLGDPADDYDRTYPEDVPEYTTAVTFLLFDRDTQLDVERINMTGTTCREVSTSLFQAYQNANNPKFVRPHPFADEGLYYYATNVHYLPAVELDFSRNGPAFDYETAPNRTEDGRRYYEYTVTAWDSFDMDSPCQKNVEGWKAPDPDFQISRTFRMYVTDVDETINLPPVLESQSLRLMEVAENKPAGTEVCCNAAEVTDRNHEHEELMYELIGEDADAFRITSGNRLIVALGGHGNGWIFTTRTLDYETKKFYTLKFLVTDPEGATAERDFTIRVLNDASDDPPPVEEPVEEEVVVEEPSEKGNKTPPPPPATKNIPPRSGGGNTGGGGSSGGGGGGSRTRTPPPVEETQADASNVEDENEVEPNTPVYSLENPGMDSFQSGVGLISGWVCEAEEVEIELNGEKQVAAYGTERVDTLDACGDTDNGFGLLFNYNLLGNGEHEVVAYVDDVEFGRATFTVTTLGEEFVRDVSPATCIVADWPGDGESVTLKWQQNSQNFVITEVQ